MKTNVWEKKKNVIVYIGGDPNKGTIPEVTLELANPQFQFDTDTNTVVITETK